MIIAFGFSLIGALLVLVNCRFLRKTGTAVVVFVLTAAITAVGIYLVLSIDAKSDRMLLFPVFSPAVALVLFMIIKMIYKKMTGREIILYVYGFFPARQHERYVTGTEKSITYLLLLLSAALPYFILKLIL